MDSQGKGQKTQTPAVKPGPSRYRLCLYSIIVLALILFSLDAIFYQGIVPHIPGMVGNTISKMSVQKPPAEQTPVAEWYLPNNQSSLQIHGANLSVYLEQLRNASANGTLFNNGAFSLGPVGVGGEYTGEKARAQIPPDLRMKLKELGIEPAEDHAFKSPYIITPNVYPKPKVQRVDDGVKTKIISIYNAPTWYRVPQKPNLMAYNRKFQQCPYYKCEVDMDGKKHQEADLVVFFVGSLGTRHPPPRPKGQLWAKAFWESPVHYGYPHDYSPWKSAFNLTYNFRVDSDIFAPNNFLSWRHRGELFSDEEYLQFALKKSKTVAWFVSNCGTQSKREEYAKELQKYIPVDIYGKCGPYKCTKANMEACKNLLNTYFFYLSFENSLCRDYITEKFFRNFESRTHMVPVVRGGADYQSNFPPEGFVDVGKFPKARDLAAYLHKLAADPKRYARMLREKDRLVTLGYKHDWCDLCQQLHTTGFPPKTIPDIKQWSHENACHKPDDIR